MNRLALAVLVSVALVVVPASAAPPPVITVDTTRLTLGDVVEEAPVDIRDTDLGPTPPPGGSRLVTRKELERRLTSSGVNAKLKLPSVVRIVSAVRTLSTKQVAEWIEPHVTAALRRGETLVKVAPRGPIKVSPRADVGRVQISKLPRRAGTHQTTAIVEIRVEGDVTQRLAVPLTIELSEAGALPDLTRGARVELIIETRSARVSAAAVALSDADVGDVLTFRVVKTRKVLRARLESTKHARVVVN